MKLDETKSLQFSIRTLLMATVAVAVWFSGLMYLRQLELMNLPRTNASFRDWLIAFEIFGMTLASTAFIFVIYGILLLMVLSGDQRRERYYREVLQSWRRFVLIGTVAAAPWLLVLARS